jgi:hypothetical protein
MHQVGQEFPSEYAGELARLGVWHWTVLKRFGKLPQRRKQDLVTEMRICEDRGGVLSDAGFGSGIGRLPKKGQLEVGDRLPEPQQAHGVYQTQDASGFADCSRRPNAVDASAGL